jgi:SAM-dependent methyltransferase
VQTSTGSADAWAAAYRRFETPEEEIAKFLRRLRAFGASTWPRDAKIVEIFCGRGNGLRALERLGFAHLEGIDLSPELLADYTGPARTVAADCRELPLETHSRDVIIVQGGLHHLNTSSSDDLERVFAEVRRVLKPDGRFVVVEPWLTPFLQFVHAVAHNPVSRRMSNKLDALHTMIEHERETYDLWLRQPRMILDLLNKHFQPQVTRRAWGKLMFMGRPIEFHG